jgi:hypothetical protein
MSDWLFDFGDEVRSERGEQGKVIGRTESMNHNGQIRRSYRLECTDAVWQESSRVWVPEYGLRRA